MFAATPVADEIAAVMLLVLPLLSLLLLLLLLLLLPSSVTFLFRVFVILIVCASVNFFLRKICHNVNCSFSTFKKLSNSVSRTKKNLFSKLNLDLFRILTKSFQGWSETFEFWKKWMHSFKGNLSRCSALDLIRPSFKLTSAWFIHYLTKEWTY